MAFCRKISMTDFTKIHTLEIELTSTKLAKRKSFCSLIPDRFKDSSKKTNINVPKFKKPSRNKLFISRKLANSLKKVRLRKKEKSVNNNFLYQEPNSSVINDKDLNCVKDLPLIPFSPNHLMESNTTQKQKYQAEKINLDQLNVWNLEMRRLENLIKEARSELDKERNNMLVSNNLDGDYVEVYENAFINKSSLSCNNGDYVDMSALQLNRPRVYSL